MKRERVREAREGPAGEFARRLAIRGIEADSADVCRIAMRWSNSADVCTIFGARRNGALCALYRHVGEHVKVGVGYDFTA